MFARSFWSVVALLATLACGPEVAADAAGVGGSSGAVAEEGSESGSGGALPVGPSGIPLEDPPACSGAPTGMVCVDEGPFWMGCDPSWAQHCNSDDADAPVHEVFLDRFAIDRLEVTVDEYGACVDAQACETPEALQGCNHLEGDRGDYPVECVRWDQADAYCRWAGKVLPTEAQWEKAARGLDARQWPWGMESADCDRAVMDDGLDGCGLGHGAPVGSRPGGASPYGVLDMAGSAHEWVADWYAPDFYLEGPPSNPSGPVTGSRHIVRGGSWQMTDYGTRTWRRGNPDNHVSTLGFGFRCAQPLE